MNPVQLPLWVEYVKALGAPIVALVAALIAGGIAYQQWRTARNKLKLDLFEKRLQVYNACVAILCELHMPGPADSKRLYELREEVASVAWLFDEKIRQYVQALWTRAFSAVTRDKVDFAALDNDQKIRLIGNHVKTIGSEYIAQIKELDDVFAPYLKLNH
jgi:hypothetical protein